MKINSDKVQKYLPIIGFILLAIIFAILTQGRILEIKNLKLILEQSILMIIGCIGVLFVMSMGGIDFSQGSIMGVACVVGAVVAYKSVVLALVCTILVGVAIGFINGFINARYKIPSFIVTICTMFVFRGLTAYLTRKESLQVPVSLYILDDLKYKIPILLLIVICGYIVFNHTKFGRQVRAIGAGETGARYSGVLVNRVKILAFCIAGATAGIAAFMNLIRVGTASASTGSLFETNILIALVLGGLPITGGAKSRFISVLIGGILLAFLTNGLVMLGIDMTIQQLIRGVIFLATVMLTVERNSKMAIK